jgi:hypothetical protein
MSTVIFNHTNGNHIPRPNPVAALYSAIKIFFHTFFFLMPDASALLTGIALRRNVFVCIRTTRVASLKTRVANFATRVAALKTHVANFATRVAGLKTRVANFAACVANLRTRLSVVPLRHTGYTSQSLSGQLRRITELPATILSTNY